jgi:glycosyltransferase involved in cell wall biosynthesis
MGELHLHGNMLQRVDLHVHSQHSSKPYSWFLRSLKSAECYTRVAEVHRIARERGMTAVTISDHDTIDGAIELCAAFPETFISEEVSARFPEDGCVVHTIAVDINEAQHREIQRLRRNIYELVPYMVEQQIPYFWCHPLSHVNSRLRPWHLRACLLMFRLLEARNGTRADAHEHQLRAIAGQLTPQTLTRYAELHPSTPWINRDAQYGFVGGSDDHGAVGIARAHTEYDGPASGAGIRAALHALAVTPGGDSGTGTGLAHNAYGVAAGAVRSSGQLNFQAAPASSAISSSVLTSATVVTSAARADRAPALGHDGDGAPRAGSSSMLQFLATMQFGLKAAGGSLAEIWRRGHLDEHHRLLSGAAELALVRQWRVTTDKLAAELGLGHIADAADLAPMMIKLTLAELPYILSYRYFGRDRGVARELSRQLFPLAAAPPPKVAIVADTTDDTNGVAIGLARLVETSLQLGYQIELIGPTTGERVERPRAGHLRVPGIYAHRLPEYPSMTWCIPHLPSLLRLLCDERIDLVQIATPGPMGIAATIAGRLLGLPVVGQYHTDVPRYAQHLLGDPTAAMMVERFVLAFYRSLDAVLVPSQFTARDLLAKGLSADKVRRIARGVPVSELASVPADRELRRRLGLDDEAFLILYVGRVSREKNLDAAIAGFARVRASVANAHLVIVGDGPMRDELVARELPGVHALGEIVGPALAGVYAACDVFLFPSETDTFANAVVEAMATGLPVITAAGSAASEHCEHDGNGFAVAIDQPDAVADALRRLAEQPALRARMAQASRTAAWRYDLVEAAHGLFATYAALLGRDEPSGGRAPAAAPQPTSPHVAAAKRAVVAPGS